MKCHAINSAGGKVGPDLARVPRPRSFYELAAALWNHAPQMARRMAGLGIARPQLDARETGDLVAFLFTLDYFDPKGNAEAGRRLFTAKRCVVCHQVGGTGGGGGPSLDSLKQRGSPISLATAMWNHGPQMADVMKALGAWNAMNLDGGASSGLWARGRYLTTPGRPISNALLVLDK